MRAFFLTCLTMVAFAMNSVLNRAAVDAGHADAGAFALVRVLAGVVALCMVLTVTRRRSLEVLSWQRWGGGLALAVYMIGFSMAYLSLDAGLGALILFGTVQIALFVHGIVSGAQVDRRQVIGAGIAFAGLVIALWPAPGQGGTVLGSLLMMAAGLGWAAYTLAGRRAVYPVAVSASHFLLCLPFMAVLLVHPDLHLTLIGLGLAILSGAVTSGLGYALWYSVLPSLPGARAGIVQLSVPILAILLGALLLSEPVGAQVGLATVLVIAGLFLAMRTSNR